MKPRLQRVAGQQAVDDHAPSRQPDDLTGNVTHRFERDHRRGLLEHCRQPGTVHGADRLEH